ncbi:hypothetical protein AB0F11_05985 [Streptomyces sp. NPDC032472]|uniref:TRADD-N-associated membrane domain-containing protein n=1 Tax=Streptomyces sp. NPDC032472 TaxID=3155018 RepID=UPI0033DCA693
MGVWGVVGAVLVGVVGLVVWGRGVGARFERQREVERERLLAQVRQPAGDGAGSKYADVSRGGGGEGAGDDGFTALLVEYYAYGLAQARSSFTVSQLFAGVGAAVVLAGVALGVWKAESAGDVYVGVVTSSVGVVVTVVGQLFHRRADVALRHMAAQTVALREDRRAAAALEQAVALLDEVADPELRARLQAGLIMKLSGSELPR